FYSLQELNARIAELLEELNNAPMKKYGGISRRELFERVERHALQPLPASRFEPCEWMSAPVRADYHIKVKDHFYSVPWELAHERVEVRVTAATVEAFVLGRRVASHARSEVFGGTTTNTAHMPSHHRWWAEKDPEPLRKWAASVGPYTEAMLEAILGSNFNREQTFKSATGLRSLADRFEADDIERACNRAVRFGGHSYKSVERILKLGLGAPVMDDEGDGEDARAPIDHDNVRGPTYYN
ncbi:MAG: Mu transposase domain-containing protein, partial [Myxococcota bacterium]